MMSTSPVELESGRIVESGDESLLERFLRIRLATEGLVEPLEVEDQVIQSMPDVSPTKWHLAHTSWFFETFVLREVTGSYQPFHPQYNYLFNSYYNSIGERHARASRGMLSRPTVAEVFEYRKHVTERVAEFIERGSSDVVRFANVIALGLNHEEQHQELILTDVKHVLSQNPLAPAYRARRDAPRKSDAAMSWKLFDGGLCQVGTSAGSFYFDNEGPRHTVYLQPFELATRLITNGEYLEFMSDGGYDRPEFWLSAGFATVQEHGWKSPLYWQMKDGAWYHFTLHGLERVDLDSPVTHISHFEADAYAAWRGARLPTEFEWEVASSGLKMDGNFVEDGYFHPAPSKNSDGLQQMFGDAWEWTRSAYLPYPGYRAAPTALGEYNGKFMSGQMVLRGGSCATPQRHIRATYRNFFPPDARWQFSGIRLARDV